MCNQLWNSSKIVTSYTHELMNNDSHSSNKLENISFQWLLEPKIDDGKFVEAPVLMSQFLLSRVKFYSQK